MLSGHGAWARLYCPAQNNIIRVRRLKECPLFPVFCPDKSAEQLHFHHGSCYLQEDDGGSIARLIDDNVNSYESHYVQ